MIFSPAATYFIRTRYEIYIIKQIIGEYPVCPLTTTIHSSLEAFHCSSAVSGWCAIATWSNGRHSKCCYESSPEVDNKQNCNFAIFFRYFIEM